MSSISTIHHDVKTPKLVKIECEENLHSKLNDHPLLSHMNRGFFALILGKPGSGKSSTWESMICSSSMLCQVFDKVYIFMPANSFASFNEKSKIHSLPENQIYENASVENLEEVADDISENREKDFKSLIILDDVQHELKDNRRVQRKLMQIVANRRHNKTSIIIAAQTYKRVPLEVRLMASDLFLFDPTRENQKQVHEELLPYDRSDFEKIMKMYHDHLRDTGKKAFLYFNLVNGAVFIGWDIELQVNSVN